ncbi:hypothetical protein [Nocardioides pakistanensis]
MSDYWLGVLTTPMVVVAGVAVFVLGVRAEAALRHRGLTFEAKWKRDTGRISDYTLRHDIWWERRFGPVFVGGWYREPPRYLEPPRRLVNRWFGVGSPDGPCWMAFRSRDLGPATEPTQQAPATCTHPNCREHGKSPCEGIGCDGREIEETTDA